MSDTLLQSLLLAAVIILVAGFLIWRVMRWMKGSVRIELDRGAFMAGETIRGQCRITARQLIESEKLVVALVGEEVTETRRPAGGRRNGHRVRRRRREIYRDETMPLAERHIAAGSEESIPFEMPVPDSIPGRSKAEGWMALGLQTGAEWLSGRRTYLSWKLVARLQCRGLNLGTSRHISLR
ncbi:hypothetical protein [Natronospira bacteriovora]|uniref:Flagellar protein FliO/FliZ n=1 Tax=Natronospira bacteriovora TaxID=3069753 RepID=A0ABU0W805_9GAMM|nr:hypothetical protein [Natronospira sp. AB-CW4]MDQ2070082.1 hypothetical protein [Natronospira sp. AB-CW4]